MIVSAKGFWFRGKQSPTMGFMPSPWVYVEVLVVFVFIVVVA